MSFVPQSVALRRDRFSKGDAYAWIRDHGYRPIKPVHETPAFFQFRLVDPERLHGGRFRTMALGDVGHLTLWYSSP